MMFLLSMHPSKFNSCILTVCLLFLLHHSLSAQGTDSLTIYHKLQEKADKHKVTSWIFDAIFVDPDNVPEENDSLIIAHSTRSIKIKNPFLAYANIPIRSVRIEVLDPFGNSVNDTFKRPTQRIQRLGNKYHVTTRQRVIRNLILFREGDPADPIKLSESERLLRQAPYINDARIFVSVGNAPVQKGRRKRKPVVSDSLDVIIRVLDKWSLEPESNFDLVNPDLTVSEKNFGGVGHQFTEGLAYNSQRRMLGNRGSYGIYNIKNTYISSNFGYYYDNLLTQFSANLDRPFYSPLAKWAGGAAFTKSYAHFLFVDSLQNNKEIQFPLDFAVLDLWLGRNFRVGNKKKLKDKVSNIFTGVRYVQLDYQRKPGTQYDRYSVYRDQSLYLANAGFSKIKYYKERYISRFGANEDIPLGFSIQVIGGYRQLELEPTRYYSGISFTNSHLFRRFYLQTTVTYGSFHNKRSTHRGVASVELFGFSNLMQTGRWYLRQFGRIKYVEGINRDAQEYITLNASEMQGFNSPVLQGKSKVFANLQTIIYMPYNLIGFRFAPVIIFGFGQVGTNITNVFASRVYHSYMLGLLVRNENLLFHTFEISISVYPYVPGKSGAQYSGLFSSGRTTPVGSFNIGKPDVLPYN